MKSAWLCALLAVGSSSTAFGQLSITFEELGPQPVAFLQTTPLTTQIAGATFSGPSSSDGGAVLNVLSNFGENPISGQHFLAFNRQAPYAITGYATDPLNIQFAQAWNSVSIFASGAGSTATFTMRAFNSSNVQIASTQTTTFGWVQLQVQAPGIVRVELVQSNGGDGFIYDDLVASGGAFTTYCTSGTTTNGCTATIGFSGIPSASGASAFSLSVSGVEGQKQGLFFYGLDNSGFIPLAWGANSSFLCVKAPTQRTTSQTSGGTAGVCNGALALDWNAFVASNPGALGVPFSAGQSVYAQSWFRDPPTPKTTNMSNAIQFTLAP